MAVTVYFKVQICELELTALKAMQPHVQHIADSHTPFAKLIWSKASAANACSGLNELRQLMYCVTQPCVIRYVPWSSQESGLPRLLLPKMLPILLVQQLSPAP